MPTPERHKVVVSADGQPKGPRNDDEGKYRSRVHPLKRTLQRLFPGLFAPGLPISNKDAAAEDSQQLGRSTTARRRRVRRSMFNSRNVLLILAVCSCLLTLLWFQLQSRKTTKSA